LGFANHERSLWPCSKLQLQSILEEKCAALRAEAVQHVAPLRPPFRHEMPEVHRQVLPIGRALVCFYLAAACFAVATLGSISGAVFAEAIAGPLIATVIAVARASGGVGFYGFIIGAAMLVGESRTAVKSLSRESDEAIAFAAQKQA
jgi:hypothetical protein